MLIGHCFVELLALGILLGAESKLVVGCLSLEVLLAELLTEFKHVEVIFALVQLMLHLLCSEEV